MRKSRDRAPGRFAQQLGISTHLTLKGDPAMAPVIATENTVVHDPVLDIDRQLIAGQPVPPDLVDVYKKKVGDTTAEQSPGEAARADADLDGLSVEELESRARAAGVYDSIEGTGANGNVVKADLVAALGGAAA